MNLNLLSFHLETRYQQIVNILGLFFCQLIGNYDQIIRISGSDRNKIDVGPVLAETWVLRVMPVRLNPQPNKRLHACSFAAALMPWIKE